MREGMEVGRRETQPGRGELDGDGTGSTKELVEREGGGEAGGERAMEGLRGGERERGAGLRGGGRRRGAEAWARGGGVSGLPRGLGLPPSKAPRGSPRVPAAGCRIPAQPRLHGGAAATAAIRRPLATSAGPGADPPPAGLQPIGSRHAEPAGNAQSKVSSEALWGHVRGVRWRRPRGGA